LEFFMKLAESAGAKLIGSEMQSWLEKLESEHDNFQSAIGWSIRDGDREEGARLAGALGKFWNIRGHYSTGRQSLESILDNAKDVSKSALGKVMNSLGTLTLNQGEYERAQKFYEESLALRRDTGDKNGIAISLKNLGNVASDQGNYDQAQKFYEESLVLNLGMGDKIGIAESLHNLGNVALYRGNYEETTKFYKERRLAHEENGSANGADHRGRRAADDQRAER
jgi:tetratricopeptide (TPR) repeat protein